MMGCYRVWKNGLHQDFHQVRLGVETSASTLCIQRDEPAPPGGLVRPLQGYLADIDGFVRLPDHGVCGAPRTYYDEISRLLNIPENGPHE